MSSNIRVPVMPEHEVIDRHLPTGIQLRGYTRKQLAARDAQWLEMVGPVVNALSIILNNNESLVFEREARAALSAITKD